MDAALWALTSLQDMLLLPPVVPVASHTGALLADPGSWKGSSLLPGHSCLEAGIWAAVRGGADLQEWHPEGCAEPLHCDPAGSRGQHGMSGAYSPLPRHRSPNTISSTSWWDIQPQESGTEHLSDLEVGDFLNKKHHKSYKRPNFNSVKSKTLCSLQIT